MAFGGSDGLRYAPGIACLTGARSRVSTKGDNMDDISRRNFLTGMVVATVGTAATVQLATPQEIATLAVGRPVDLIPEAVPMEPLSRPGTMVYFLDSHDNQFKPLGLLTEMSWSTDRMESTAFGSQHRAFVRGVTRVEFRGVSVGPFTVPLR